MLGILAALFIVAFIGSAWSAALFIPFTLACGLFFAVAGNRYPGSFEFVKVTYGIALVSVVFFRGSFLIVASLAGADGY